MLNYAKGRNFAVRNRHGNYRFDVAQQFQEDWLVLLIDRLNFTRKLEDFVMQLLRNLLVRQEGSLENALPLKKL